MANKVALILSGDEEAPVGTETLVERYQMLSIVGRCAADRETMDLVYAEMDEIHDLLLTEC